MKMNIAIEWKDGLGEGKIEVVKRALLSEEIVRGAGMLSGNRFSCQASSPCRMALAIDGESLGRSGRKNLLRGISEE